MSRRARRGPLLLRSWALAALTGLLPWQPRALWAQELREEKEILREHIATKYKLFQNAFRHFDEDHSGYIDRAELEHGIQHFNLPIPVEHVKQIAQEMDRGLAQTPNPPHATAPPPIVPSSLV